MTGAPQWNALAAKTMLWLFEAGLWVATLPAWALRAWRYREW